MFLLQCYPLYSIDRAMLLGKCMELMQLICRVLPSILVDTRVYMATRITKNKD